LHGTLGGNPNLLEFAPRLTDEALRLLYAQAIATITPSRAEGFSMPIIEASANGCPVIAANCDAQAELLGDPRDLFAADDVTTLQLKLESFYQRPELREQARARQSGLGLRFEQSIISRRFWSDFSTQIERRARNPRRSRKRSVPAPAVLRKVKPRVAFLTPLPPDPSGVADFSAATLAALAHRANVSVFSSTKDPVMPDGVCRDIRPVSAMPYLSASHDAVVSVVGNSHFHLEIFHQMMRWGSASIAHDARMLNFYSLLLGEQRTIAVASAELGRPVTADEIQKWLMDQHSLPALLLDEIAGMSHPLMMHSRLTAEILRSRGIATVTLPFSPYRVLPDEALSPDAKRKARENLMLPQDDLIVATFGNVSPDRAIEDGLWAVEFLRAWGFPARLACIGPVNPEFNRYLNNIAASIGMQNYLFLTPDGVSEHVYRLWLSAADVAFQLRTYKLGGLSGALLDCIAAGLPTVANLHLAEAMEAPEWVRRVPDGISAVLIAEQLAAIIAEGIHRARPLAARAALLKARGFDVYATRLMEGLGFEQPQKRHRARSER
jgi:glycosyltransferase involved in cell wall biosynthesis